MVAFEYLDLDLDFKSIDLKCVFGTPDSNPNSVIQIQNHWVPHQKNLFVT